ncbi:MerR family DNA-binding protein [Oerskovia sp. M15]
MSFIRVSQRVGIPRRGPRSARHAAAEPDSDRQDWRRLSREWHADLDARIEQLVRLRDHLTDCIGCGCLSLRKCVLANPHDVLAVEGPGPRTLLVEGLED